MISKTLLTLVIAGTVAACGASSKDELPADGGVPSDGDTANTVDTVNQPDGADAPAMSSCGSSDVPRPVTFRLEFPAAMPMPTVDFIFSPLELTISGIVGAISRGQGGALRIPITDVEKNEWVLLISPVGGIDQWEASATEVSGKAASLLFRFNRGFQIGASSAFVLKSADEFVMAAEAGPYVTVLGSADLPFSIVSGPPICKQASHCATLVYTALRFEGDTTAVVGLAEDGEFTLGGRQYTARNSGDGHHENVTCTDLERGSFWSVYRRSLS
jgi:hypothetical protein